MEPKDLDLNKLKTPLELSLRGHLRVLDGKLGYGGFPEFKWTPDGVNSARTKIPITYDNQKVGDMYAIVFFPGDGTGDQETFKLNQVTIPSGLYHEDKPWRVIPRAKTGVLVEGFFPLFSIREDRGNSYFAAHLDELTIEDEFNRIVPAWKLGQKRQDFLDSMDFGWRVEPRVQITTIDDDKGVFGNPHAIYNRMIGSGIAQVVGFLSVNRGDEDNPILTKGIVDKWYMPSLQGF